MISVCCPVYEQSGMGVRYMTELLNSIQMQRGCEFETIISDNSRDDKIEILCSSYKSIGLKYYRNLVSFGTSNNTNNAITQATSDKIKIMYSDDVFLLPSALAEFEAALNRKHWAVCVSRAMDKQGRLQGLRTPRWNDKLLKGYNTIGMPSVMATRRNAFTFDHNLTTLLDCEYYWRLHELYGEPEYIASVLVAQRFWDVSMSHIVGDNKVKDYEYLTAKHGLK